MESPREFWIDPEWGFDDEHESDPDENYFGSVLKQHPGQGPLMWQSSLIHVIEYSAYDRLAQENAELREAFASIIESGERGERVDWGSYSIKDYEANYDILLQELLRIIGIIKKTLSKHKGGCDE